MTHTTATLCPFALTFKAGDSRTRVNHTKGIGIVQAQELGDFFFIMIILSIASSEPWFPQVYVIPGAMGCSQKSFELVW